MKKEMTKITINLSKDLLDKTKVAADRTELTVSALIRKLLLEYLKEE
jgi:metal-responsive CopG/Arc/MetJ family transcriptional regulator